MKNTIDTFFKEDYDKIKKIESKLKKMHKSKDKFLYSIEYIGYGRTYDIYTKDEIMIQNMKAEKKYDIAAGSIWTIFFIVLITSAMILGLSPSISMIAGFILASINIILLTLAIMLAHKYCTYNRIVHNFRSTDEYKTQFKMIYTIRDILHEIEKKKKAKNLIEIYDTLDDKELSKEKKIEILKDYMENK